MDIITKNNFQLDDNISWSLILSSDPQFGFHGETKIHNLKKNDIFLIQKYANKYKIKVVITAGDLTEHGYNGKDPIFGFFNIKNQPNEFNAFLNEWVYTINKIQQIDKH